jgi:hypothetical protein
MCLIWFYALILAQVPDGKYILYLYQTESIADVVDETSISSTFRIEDISMIPERDDRISDFYYGKKAPDHARTHTVW